MNKLILTPEDIVSIYAGALESETGMPLKNLAKVFTYESYDIQYISAENKSMLTIYGVNVQFELEDAVIKLVNYNYYNKGGWQLAF